MNPLNSLSKSSNLGVVLDISNSVKKKKKNHHKLGKKKDFNAEMWLESQVWNVKLFHVKWLKNNNVKTLKNHTFEEEARNQQGKKGTFKK